MTEEAQRIALAKVDGWTCVSPAYLVGLRPGLTADDFSARQVLENEVPMDPIPTYTSLDDLHRIEERLTRDQRNIYINMLDGAIETEDPVDHDFEWCCAGVGLRRHCLLKTLSLWTESHE